MPSSVKHRVRRYWPVVTILLVGLTVSWALSSRLQRQAIELDKQRFDLEATYMTATLEQTMERYEERLARLADYCAQVQEMNKYVWSFRSGQMTDLSYNLPSVIHAVYCPKIPAVDFEAHFERVPNAIRCGSTDADVAELADAPDSHPTRNQGLT